MEDITNKWCRLSLSKQEGDGFSLHNEMSSNEFILAAKFYTNCILNTEPMARIFTQLWRSRNGFRIKDLGNHIVLFIFDNKLETDRILENQPWSFDKHIVALQRYEKGMHIRNLCFELVPFWVQLYDIAVLYMNKVVAKGICSRIGKVCSSENNEMESGDFMRVRAIIDVSKPLSRGRKISLEDGKNDCVSFKYERLSNICYWCGCITHSDRDCNLWIDSEGSLKIESRQFGPWLRTPPFSMSKKSTITVSRILQAKEGGIKKKKNQPVREVPQPPTVHVTKQSCHTAVHSKKVIPESEPILNSFPKLSKPPHDEDDFPPGFEGQGCQRVIFARQLEEIDGALKIYDYMEGVDNYADSIPNLESSNVPTGTFTDPNMGGSSPIISPSLFSSLALNDVSNLQHLPMPTSQTQTWKRLNRADSSKNKKPEVLSGKKRVSIGTGDHVDY